MDRTVRNRRANVVALLLLLGSSLAVPSIGWAGSGGASLQPPASGPDPTAIVHSGNVAVTATADGITVASNASALLSKQLRVTGTVSRSAAGQTVEIERLGRETNWLWAPTVHATVAADGSFTAVWQTNHIGRFSIRAVIAAPMSAQPAAAAPTVTVTVYRPSIATWYGPGLYGRTTACGEVLKPTTVGTANRTLKCGTPVAIYYRGRTMVVPVIDRGPYANGADWDLTEATARAMQTGGVTTIGAVSLPRR
jgi:rare lipoprotein A